MDDMISRQAAIEALEEPHKVPDILIDEYAVGERMQWNKDVKALNSLPAVEREKGTWIKKMRVTETEKYTSYESEWYCPCCGTKYDPHIAQFVNFCYVCGLDLRERKEK